MELQINVLGPIDVTVDGRHIDLAGQRQRALLAALTLDAGNAVSTDRLVDALWGADPPLTARARIHSHVSGLRRVLGVSGKDARWPIATRPPGYLISVDGVRTDQREFAGLIIRSRKAAGRPDLASDILGAALALWRGPAFADVDSDLIRAAAACLEEERLLAIEEKARADLRLGRHTVVVAELASPCYAHPLREQLWALLMLALYRRSCRAEALAAYRSAHKTIVKDLGLEPGIMLHRLHRLMLTDDPALFSRPVDELIH